MPTALALDLAQRSLLLAVMLAGPLLLAALVVGLIVSMLQAVTQVQEQTLVFVVKLIAVGIVFLVCMSWMLQVAVKFTFELFTAIPTLVN